ncbi:MAG: hypothetical protein LBB60_02780 [Desulfovibrio sp.]|nr:hypothetical protein [Desulfovibrio sp.]
MVEQPSVENIYVDQARGITYKIMAYRPLTKEEMLQGVGVFMRQKNAKKFMKRGSTIKIISVIH